MNSASPQNWETDLPPRSRRLESAQWGKAVLALVLGLVVTGLAWQYTLEQSVREEQAGFTRLAADSTRALRQQISLYTETVRGISALFAASEEVTAREFTAYIKALEPSRRLPALDAAFYHVPSQGGYRTPYRAFPGIPESAGMELIPSIETGVPAGNGAAGVRAGPPFQWGGEMAVAFYHQVADGENGRSPAVSIVVNMDDLMDELFRPRRFRLVTMKVSDVDADPDANPPLFDSTSVIPGIRDRALETRTDPMLVGNRRWRIEYRPGTHLVRGTTRWLPPVVLSGGLVTTGLLFAMMLTSMSRASAVLLAGNLRRDLQESEERLGKIIRSLDDVIWSVSLYPHRHFSFISPSAEKVFARPLTHFYQDPDLWLNDVHPGDRKEVERMRESAWSQPETHMEYRIRLPNGTERWLYHRSFLVRDGRGEPVRLDEIISDITERKADEVRIHHLAFFDALTNLPNRTVLEDRLAQAIHHASRHGGHVAVLFVDLDEFKSVNDRFGHAAGDRLLQEVAKRISTSLRKEDTATRLSGDEFILVLPDVDDADAAATVAAKVTETLAQPYDLAGETVEVTASVGVSLYPLDGTDGDTLMRHADEAMYRAKGEGRNTYRLYGGGERS